MEVNLMKEVTFEENKFLVFEQEGVNFVFSTAENNLNFNKNLSEGRLKLEKLKDWFKVENIGYSNQIHSDIVNLFNGTVIEGDSLITNKTNSAIGIFTADCVPILLYDSVNKVIAAVHSGWRSTVSDIVIKTVNRMTAEYKTKAEDITAYIGPHNRVCCYEVGMEVIDRFKNNQLFSEEKFLKDNNLNLAYFIHKQLNSLGVKAENIHDTELCTFCSKDYKLHSYRKDNGSYGRMFSFIFMKD